MIRPRQIDINVIISGGRPIESAQATRRNEHLGWLYAYEEQTDDMSLLPKSYSHTRLFLCWPTITPRCCWCCITVTPALNYAHVFFTTVSAFLTTCRQWRSSHEACDDSQVTSAVDATSCALIHTSPSVNFRLQLGFAKPAIVFHQRQTAFNRRKAACRVRPILSCASVALTWLRDALRRRRRRCECGWWPSRATAAMFVDPSAASPSVQPFILQTAVASPLAASRVAFSICLRAHLPFVFSCSGSSSSGDWRHRRLPAFASLIIYSLIQRRHDRPRRRAGSAVCSASQPRPVRFIAVAHRQSSGKNPFDSESNRPRAYR